MSLITRLALGRPPSYEQRTPHVPTPTAAGVVYAHPDDAPLLAAWAKLGLATTGALRVITSTHVPAGYVHTADDETRDRVDALLASHYAERRLTLLAR